MKPALPYLVLLGNASFFGPIIMQMPLHSSGEYEKWTNKGHKYPVCTAESSPPEDCTISKNTTQITQRCFLMHLSIPLVRVQLQNVAPKTQFNGRQKILRGRPSKRCLPGKWWRSLRCYDSGGRVVWSITQLGAAWNYSGPVPLYSFSRPTTSTCKLRDNGESWP